MRLIILLWSACTPDYALHPVEVPPEDPFCSFEPVETWGGEEVLVCSGERLWPDAAQACANYGGELLVSPGVYAEHEELGELGAEMIGPYWHVGWPTYYECPAMSRFGGSTPRYDCAERTGFMCSFHREGI